MRPNTYVAINRIKKKPLIKHNLPFWLYAKKKYAKSPHTQHMEAVIKGLKEQGGLLPVSRYRHLKKLKYEQLFKPYQTRHDFHVLEPLYCNDFEKKKEERTKMWLHRLPRQIAKITREHLHEELREEGENKASAYIDNVGIGDAVEVRFKTSVEQEKPIKFRGILIGEKKKGFDYSMRILGAHEGTAVEYIFQRYSPLLFRVKLLKKNFVKNGKRVKRAKLYYLRERPIEEIMIPKELYLKKKVKA